jgi:hypothetical protein
MPCLFAMFAGLFPRFADIFIWIARPALFNAAFKGSWLWPVLGIIFLPFTTLMYIILFPMTGWDWTWIVLAVFLDLSHYAHTAYNNRAAIPGQSSTPSTPSAPSAPSA